MNKKKSNKGSRLLSRLLFSLILFFVLIFLLEAMARIHPESREAEILFREVVKGKWQFTQNDQGQVFEVPKRPGTYRVFCFGGSAAVGSIYNPVSSFPKHLQNMLSDSARYGRVEVINCAKTAYNSDDVLLAYRKAVDFEPDLLVVYSGNNELSEYHPINQIETPVLHAAIFFLRKHSNAYRFIQSYFPSMIKVYGAFAGFREEKDLSIDINIYTPEKRRTIEENYIRNMTTIIELSNERNIGLILCTTATNIRDWPPLKSRYPEDMPLERRRKLRKMTRRALEDYVNGRYERAAKTSDKILDSHPEYALAWFVRGRVYMEKGEDEAAEMALTQALNNDDSFSMRAPTYHYDELRKLADRESMALLDINRLFNERSAHGMAGFNLLDDYCHPNLDGQLLIASIICQNIVEREPDRFQAADTEPTGNKEHWLERVGADNAFLAKRTQEMAFYLAFSNDNPLISQQAEKMFERLNKYVSASSLPDIGKALLEIRRGQKEQGQENLASAFRMDPEHARRMCRLYFSGFIRLDGPFVLVRGAPGTDFRGILNDYLRVTGVSKGHTLNTLTLEDTDYCFYWDKEEETFKDITPRFSNLVSERDRLSRNAGKEASVIFSRDNTSAVKPVNMVNSGETSWKAVAADPQLIMDYVSIKAARYATVRIVAGIESERPDKEGKICVYWRGQGLPDFHEDLKECVPLKGGGEKREYSFHVGENPAWLLADSIDALRVDPGERMTEITVEKIELVPFIKDN